MLDTAKITEEEVLALHASGKPGKLEIQPTKQLSTQRDLSLLYSPGVAIPCEKIYANPQDAYAYTNKGNLVAVISNGTAVLGLGDLGALASKPVMEGKCVLLKKFAGVDAIDLEVDTRDIDQVINCVKYLEPSFGGINLEDIKAPDCFFIEEALKKTMKIPVFHDDQHGTAIIATAGLINALDLTGRKIGEIKLVINGAGAAAIACADLLVSLGLQKSQIIMCDSKGVIYKGRTEGMNQWKESYAQDTQARSLEDAMRGADVFLGVSVKDAVTPQMVQSMAKDPIIFALANPDPEITPAEVRKVCPTAIIATGRSDYPNQVNNVLGFPYIFRGALDVRASTINEEMKIAAAQAIAALAREKVPESVSQAYKGKELTFGRDYIIPVPFDTRLIEHVPVAVAQAAMKSGVAQKHIKDFEQYKNELRARHDPTLTIVQRIFAKVKDNPKTVIFAEGEEDRTIQAAFAFEQEGFGKAILIGRENEIQRKLELLNLADKASFTIHNAALSTENERYAGILYEKHQRKGMMYRDCMRLVQQDRHIFSALMMVTRPDHTLVTGLTRGYRSCLDKILRVIDSPKDVPTFGLTMSISQNHAIFIADTTVHEQPTAQQLADIAIASVSKVRQLGFEPRVAFLSHSNFGQNKNEYSTISQAVRILDARSGIDFEYEGEMTVDVALDFDLMKNLFPFSRLTGPANILIMPDLNSANIAAKLLGKTGATNIGPILMGLSEPVQITPMSSTVSDLLNLAVVSCYRDVSA